MNKLIATVGGYFQHGCMSNMQVTQRQHIAQSDDIDEHHDAAPVRDFSKGIKTRDLLGGERLPAFHRRRFSEDGKIFIEKRKMEDAGVPNRLEASPKSNAAMEKECGDACNERLGGQKARAHPFEEEKKEESGKPSACEIKHRKKKVFEKTPRKSHHRKNAASFDSGVRLKTETPAMQRARQELKIKEGDLLSGQDQLRGIGMHAVVPPSDGAGKRGKKFRIDESQNTYHEIFAYRKSRPIRAVTGAQDFIRNASSRVLRKEAMGSASSGKDAGKQRADFIMNMKQAPVRQIQLSDKDYLQMSVADWMKILK
jgi:hypothetical protein